MTKIQKQFLVGACIIALAVGSVIFVHRTGTVTSGDKAWGPDNAPVTIVEFTDFQCPACARSQESLKKLFEDFPNQIKLHFKHFPLGMHVAALEASKAAECAHEQGKFWAYEELLFDQQMKWGPDIDVQTLLRAYGNDVGLDSKLFDRCMGDKRILERIEKDKMEGQALKVGSTPTFFINGSRVVGYKQLEEKGPEMIRNILSGKQAEKGSSANEAQPMNSKVGE